MKLAAVVSFAVLLLAGCAQKAKRVEPVSFAKVEQRHAEAQAGLTRGREHNARAVDSLAVARGAVGRAKMAADYQLEALALLKPRVATLMQNVPPALRPEVEAIAAQVGALEARTAEAAQAARDADQAATEAAQSQEHVNTSLESTNAAVEGAKKELTEAAARTAAVTAAANRNADLADAAQKSAARRGNFLGLACGLGLAALATHLMRVAPPYSFALPIAAFGIGYFAARLLT